MRKVRVYFGTSEMHFGQLFVSNAPDGINTKQNLAHKTLRQCSDYHHQQGAPDGKIWEFESFFAASHLLPHGPVYFMKIHEKIKVMRLFKNWSQEEMAEKLGYSLSGYTKIEHGETDINISKLEKIAETLGIDLQRLWGLNEGNVFNVAENCSPTHLSQGYILLSEAQCAHELDKARLIASQKDMEIFWLKEEVDRLKEIISLLKTSYQPD